MSSFFYIYIYKYTNSIYTVVILKWYTDIEIFISNDQTKAATKMVFTTLIKANISSYKKEKKKSPISLTHINALRIAPIGSISLIGKIS